MLQLVAGGFDLSQEYKYRLFGENSQLMMSGLVKLTGEDKIPLALSKLKRVHLSPEAGIRRSAATRDPSGDAFIIDRSVMKVKALASATPADVRL